MNQVRVTADYNSDGSVESNGRHADRMNTPRLSLVWGANYMVGPENLPHKEKEEQKVEESGLKEVRCSVVSPFV